jgi:hypothetical protein
MYMGPGVYRHYKGRSYKVLGMSTNTENGEVAVVYHDTQLPSILCHRPIENFNQFVVIDNVTTQRFQKED